MLRRILVLALIGIALLALAAGGLGLILLRTAAGQRFVLDRALPMLARETGIGAEIGRAGGAWPGEICLTRVRLTDARGVWFEAKGITLLWRPWAALAGRFLVDAVIIDGGNLMREPVTPESGPHASEPRHYPLIRVASLSAQDFHLGESFIDEALNFNLKGAFEIGHNGDVVSPVTIDLATSGLVAGKLAELIGPRARLRARITGTAAQVYSFADVWVASADGTIQLAGSGSYDIATHHVRAELKGAVPASVAPRIANNLALRGPTRIAAQADGPYNDLKIHVGADVAPVDYEKRSVPPAHLDATLIYGHRFLSGPLRIVFADAAAHTPASSITGTSSYDFKRLIRIDDFAAAYRGAQASGKLSISTDGKSGAGTLGFNIPDLGVLPLPLDARGSLDGKASFDLGGAGKVEAQLKSSELALGKLVIAGLAVSASGSLQDMKFEISADALSQNNEARAGGLAIAGTLRRDEAAFKITIERLTALVANRPARLASPTDIILRKDEIELAPTQLSWGDKGQIRASGSLGRDLTLKLAVQSIELPWAPLVASGELDVDTRAAQAGTLALKLAPLEGVGLQLRSEIQGRWANGRVSLSGAIEGFGQDAAFTRIEPVALSLPLTIDRHAGQFALKTPGPIEGRVRYAGPIDRFLLLVPVARQTMKGAAELDVGMSGTLADPRFAGHVSLAGGTYENAALGLYLDRISARARIDHTGNLYLLIFDATASDGRGDGASPISVKGQIQLAPRLRIEANVHLDHARGLRTRDLSLETSGDLKLSGTMAALRATGTVMIHNLEFQIPNALPPDIISIKIVKLDKDGNPIAAETPASPQNPIEIALDISIVARQQVFIRGRGLDSEWSTNLHLTGTANDPRLDGALTLKRGRFDFSGQQFDLTQGAIRFVPSRSADPDLVIEAQNKAISGTAATITVSGKASHPVIKLTSDPPLPQEDVMALVLFGRPAAQLSPLQAVQVANAVGTLTGEGPLSRGSGILDRTRASLGLDLLNVSVGGETPGVTVGKYVTRRVLLSASPSFGAKPGSVAAEVEVSKSISVETSVGQDAQGNVAVKWKHDY
jgi:autotransporter translocation and assembly factor TamB